jgi:hypothetical protein
MRWRSRVRGLATPKRADERGQALAMTLLTMFALSVAVVTVMMYAGSTEDSSHNNHATESAFDLAESGLNEAYSRISVAGSDTTGVPTDPATNVTTVANGSTQSWGATYDATTRTWTVTSIGIHASTAGGAPIKRTLTGKVQLLVPPYTFASLSTTCDSHQLLVTTSGTLTVTNGIYVNSCNTGHDAFDVMGSGGSISAPSINVVGGWETHSGDLVIVNGVTCSLQNDNPPDAFPPAGCPKVGQPSIGDPFAGKITAPTLSPTGACQYPVYGSVTPWGTHPKLSVAMTTAQVPTTTITATLAVPANNGDVIVVENEDMLVISGGGTTSLLVQRGYLGTTVANHGSGKEIKYLPVTGTAGTALLPGPCNIPSGTVTLNPGTYYGGICIGASSGNDCGAKNDSTKANIQDVALYSMASTGPNGALGSISGTIYAPGPYAIFADAVSGTANLAVLTSCMLIDGGNSTFAFNPGGLFGVAGSIKVTGQYG